MLHERSQAGRTDTLENPEELLLKFCQAARSLAQSEGFTATSDTVHVREADPHDPIGHPRIRIEEFPSGKINVVLGDQEKVDQRYVGMGNSLYVTISCQTPEEPIGKVQFISLEDLPNISKENPSAAKVFYTVMKLLEPYFPKIPSSPQP